MYLCVLVCMHMAAQLHITLSDELLGRIDAARNEGQPRADWVRRAVEFRLEVLSKNVAVERASGGSSGGHRAQNRDRLPAPAEQPVSEAKDPATNEQADPGSVPSSEGVRSAPAAQEFGDPLAQEEAFREASKTTANLRRVAQSQRGQSSRSAKSGVGPRPKGTS